MKFGAVNSATNIAADGRVISVTPGANIALDITTGSVASWTAGENETITVSGTPFLGQELTCIIANDATLARTINFGTGFRVSAAIIGTASTVSTIKFIGDGTSLIEVTRTVAIT